MRNIVNLVSRAWDRFLFAGPEPEVCSLVRILMAILLGVNGLCWLIDVEALFTDSGFISSQTVRQSLEGDRPSLFYWIPGTTTVMTTCVVLYLANCLFLLIGFFGRIQAASLFFWLVSFQHRNGIICDGQDVVMRLFAFYMIFMPLDHAWSVRNIWRGSRAVGETVSAWGLRLIQIQLTAIYLSTGWEKAQGETWWDGRALYYVTLMDDLFGRFWLPSELTKSTELLMISGWGVLVVELGLPFLLWFPQLRWIGVGLGICFHLAIEYSMNIFLFEWAMIVGLLAFGSTKWHGWRWMRNSDSQHRSEVRLEANVPNISRQPMPQTV